MQNFVVPKKVNALFLAFMAVGLVALVAGFLVDAPRAWAGLLALAFFVLILALSAGFFTAIQYVTVSKWSVVLRRLPELITSAVLPAAAVLIAAVFVGIPHLYEWANPEIVAHDHILQAKSGWLNQGFFMARIAFFLLVWYAISRQIKKVSMEQDISKDPAKTTTLIKLSTAYLITYAYFFLVTAMDLTMSLEPHFQTTMYPVYCFAGSMYSGMAALIIMLYFIKTNNGLKEVTEDHIHDVGKFQFMFIVFWAYIAFSMEMLTWYANLPEETIFLERRVHAENGWGYFTLGLWIFHFAVPFFIMLSAKLKKDIRRLVKMAWFILFMGFVDVIWLVYGGLQEHNVHGFPLGWMEIGLFFGAIGTYGYLVLNAFSKVNQVPSGDPLYQESVKFHQSF